MTRLTARDSGLGESGRVGSSRDDYVVAPSRILCNGVRPDGSALVVPRSEADLTTELKRSLLDPDVPIERHAAATFRCARFGEQQPLPGNPLDPRSAGWTYIVNPSSPHFEDYKRAIAPLARHRAMVEPDQPLEMDPAVDSEHVEWLEREFLGLGARDKQVPAYVLLVGSPAEIPFSFQSLLATVASVGRLDFDDTEALTTYVEKVLRIETDVAPIAQRRAAFFGSDAGPADPAYFSRRYMVEPLGRHVQDKLGLDAVVRVAEQATPPTLLELAADNPALLFTASHGMAAVDDGHAAQIQSNGALVCHEGMFGSADVPTRSPFLHGGVFFQFACFGYGTPDRSDYSQWNHSVPERYTTEPFVASLPKALLAQPTGPVAYVGHVDLAWLHGFSDPEEPHAVGRWHERIAPLKYAVEQILAARPVGFAMHRLNEKLNTYNQALNATRDRFERNRIKWDDEANRRYLDRWINRGDAQNYMVLGDPGAKVQLVRN